MSLVESVTKAPKDHAQFITNQSVVERALAALDRDKDRD